jgi:lysophospholipase L1-like esterase
MKGTMMDSSYLALLIAVMSGFLELSVGAAKPQQHDAEVSLDMLTPPAGVNQAACPFPKLDWVDAVRAHNAEAAKVASSIQLVFDGDSITSWFANYSGPGNSGVSIWNERYAKLGAFNFGIPGDCTQHLLWRLSQGQMNGIRPKLILLMIGTNNIERNTDQEIAEGNKAIVDEYRKQCPDAVILLQGIFPRGRLASDPVRARIKAINKILATYADGKKVHFVDLGDKFLQPDGSISAKIMRDFAHPNERGYRIWADAIQSYIDRCLTPLEANETSK